MSKFLSLPRCMALVCTICIAYTSTAYPAVNDPKGVPLVRSTTRLVQLSVVVHDKHGAPVKGLTKNDFQLLDDGKPREIQLFAEESSSADPTPQALPPGVYANEAARGNTPGNVVIILIDDLNTEWQDQASARGYLIKFLKTIQPQDHVGLYTMGASFRVLHDFTSNSADLVGALKNFSGEQLPDLAASTPAKSISIDPLASLFPGSELFYPQIDLYLRNRVLSTLATLKFIANHVASLPGRKSLIWVSAGFPLVTDFEYLAQRASDRTNIQKPRGNEQRAPGNSAPSPEMGPADLHNYWSEFKDAMQTITRANLSVYPVDPRGLVPDSAFNAQAKRVTLPDQPRLDLGQTQATMLEIADATGGKAYYNRNDIDGAIRSAIKDGDENYSIGFYPDEQDLGGRVHKLKLRLAHESGVTLRCRKTYSERPLKEPDVSTRKAQVSEAAWGPMDANGIPLGSSLIRGTTAGSVQVQTLIATHALSLFPDGDRWSDNLDVLVVQRDKAGNVLDGSYDTLDVRLKPETYQALLRNGYIHRKEIRLLPKTASVRVVVRDGGSGEVGSVTIPLPRT